MNKNRTRTSSSSTPVKQGYRMPAEWEKHAATWLSWPNNTGTWTEDMEVVEQSFVTMIRWIVRGEKLFLCVDNAAEKKRISGILKANKISEAKITYIVTPTVDVWIRDYGPNFLIGKNLAYNRWYFNAWGGKYPDLAEDHGVLDRIRKKIPGKRFEPGIILEGGSIEVNGKGMLLTTKQCLLNPNRNPKLKQKDLETMLKDHLNLNRIVWLEDGVDGDDTDGHIDDIARFVNDDTVIVVRETDKKAGHYHKLERNIRILKAEGLNVIPMPLPKQIHYGEQVLPASYANFYICNAAVLVPIFKDPNDKAALKLLKKYFPGREIVGIDCRVMVRGYGSIHCASQQQPAVTQR